MTIERDKKIGKIIRLSNQMVSMHTIQSERSRTLNSVLTITGLAMSMFLLSLSMASNEYLSKIFKITQVNVSFLLSVFAVGNFFVTILLIYFRPGELFSTHMEAVRRFSKTKQAAEDLLKTGKEVTIQELNNLERLFYDVKDLPRIKDSAFLKLKKKHLMKLAISKKLEETPFKSIKSIKKELKKEKPPKVGH